MRTSRTGLAALAAAGIALLAAACSSSPASTTAASTTSARPSASAAPHHAATSTCTTPMKLTQPANGTRLSGQNGTLLMLKVCGTGASRFYMPIDVDPDNSVTLDYDANTADGPQQLKPMAGAVVFYDQGVGNLGVNEHMQIGYQPITTTQCATFIQDVPSQGGDYTTTLAALKHHGCVTPVLVHVTAVNR